MSTEYSQPRRRARTFGLGILSGSALSQENIVEMLQSNINFRLDSARAMLQGGTEEMDVSPINRRQEIRDRRLDMLSELDGPLSSIANRAAQAGGGGTKGSSSGSIGQSSSGTRSSRSVKSGTPSMSEVDRGTKKRAEERGFQ